MRPLLVAIVLTIVALSGGARAESLDACLTAEDRELRIAACGAVIDSDVASAENRAIAYTKRGLARLNQGREGLALQDFDAAIHLDRGAAQAYLYRGVTQMRLGRRLHAIFDYNAVLAFDPDNAAAYFHRGTAYLYDDVPHMAVEDLSASLRLRPDYAPAHINRGDAYLQDGRPEDAIRDYDKALKLDPGRAPVYRQRGNANRALGRYDRAIEDYDRALAIDPGHISTYNSRGLVYAKIGMVDQAIEDYSLVIKYDPKLYHPHWNRALAYAWFNRLDAAQRDLDNALTLTTARELANWFINSCAALGRIGRPDFALPYCRKGVALLPSGAAHDQLAFVLWQLGDFVGARRELEAGNQVVQDAQRIDIQVHMRRYPVLLAQGLLRGLGYLPDDADGILNDETESAIRRFQEAEALEVDGRLSDDLVAALLSARPG